jgi:uncharacterized protein YoxC
MSAVQFNLLPDVKLSYIKAQRTRNLVISISFLVSAAAFVIFLIMLLTVDVVQKKQLSDANKSIKSASSQLQNITGLNQVLTIQNQLSALSTINKTKNITSRVFTFLPQVTPSRVSIGQVSADYTTKTMQLNGTADSQASVNVFVDTLKFATYKIGDQDSEHSAFPSVILNSFSISTGKSSYSMTIQFDPLLFSNSDSQVPKLSIKNQVTTQSVLGNPANLFNGQVGTPKTGGQ